MKQKPTNNFELNIIKRFSKFILEFNNVSEFKEFIKKNKFKIMYERLIDIKDRKNLYNHIFRNYDKFNKIREKMESKEIPSFRAFFLVSPKKIIGLIPLNSFIKDINNWGEDIDILYKSMENDGRYFLYWNKDYMVYDDEIEPIETIMISRKYVGTKKIPKYFGFNKIMVLGLDGKERTVEEEGIEFFKSKGYKAKIVQYLDKDKYTRDCFENDSVWKIISKEDKKKIRTHDNWSYTGFPDLFIWNNKGDYFFVEVKSEKDKLHLSQREWIRWNKKFGKFKFKVLRIKDKK